MSMARLQTTVPAVAQPQQSPQAPALTRWRQKINKRATALVVLLVVWAGLCFASFYNAYSISQVYPAISLRYSGGITTQTAEDARRYAIKNNAQTNFWPTYWAQQNTRAESTLGKADISCLYFDGDAALVWPANFIKGSYPGPVDYDGCAISNKLAWQLYGSTDVIGLGVKINDKNYIVRGVFDSKDMMVLAACNTAPQAGWQNVELAGQPTGTNLREEAEQFATASGLGAPSHVVNGQAWGSLLQLAASLPLIAILVWGLVVTLRNQKKIAKYRRNLLLFCLLFALALALPWALGKLPAWLIPTRWSDFSFWGSVVNQIKQYLQEWWLLPPTLKEVKAKATILLQIFIVFGQLFLLPVLWGATKLPRNTPPKTQEQPV